MPRFARPTIKITLPFTANPITFKIVARPNICNTIDPLTGDVNCGNSASTNSAIFGLRRLVAKPSEKIRSLDMLATDFVERPANGSPRNVLIAR